MFQKIFFLCFSNIFSQTFSFRAQGPRRESFDGHRFNTSSLVAAGRILIGLMIGRHNIYLGQFPVKVCLPLVFGPFSLKPRSAESGDWLVTWRGDESFSAWAFPTRKLSLWCQKGSGLKTQKRLKFERDKTAVRGSHQVNLQKTFRKVAWQNSYNAISSLIISNFNVSLRDLLVLRRQHELLDFPCGLILCRLRIRSL